MSRPCWPSRARAQAHQDHTFDTDAEAGKESTRDLQARIGRSARLGPRSVGVLDAGATSCWLILDTMARSLRRQLG